MLHMIGIFQSVRSSRAQQRAIGMAPVRAKLIASNLWETFSSSHVLLRTWIEVEMQPGAQMGVYH